MSFGISRRSVKGREERDVARAELAYWMEKNRELKQLVRNTSERAHELAMQGQQLAEMSGEEAAILGLLDECSVLLAQVAVAFRIRM